MGNFIKSITMGDIRQTIKDFLQQRIENHLSYKSAQNRLAQAETENDANAICESKAILIELEKKFEFDNWMEDAFTRRINWLILASHLSKGINPSSDADNINYDAQHHSPLDYAISSATLQELPLDVTGSAAALDIFVLLNKIVKNEETLLQLVKDEHPALIDAFSDNKDKALIYVSNIKKLMTSKWENPKASELNKQLYWPASDQSFLSQTDDRYRVLIPLHPSSLCNVVFQKIQGRFSEENKEAMKQRPQKNIIYKEYFTFPSLAVIQIGGSNAQNVSLLIGRQKGKNFLLPSIPPQINSSKSFRIKKSDKTLFSSALFRYCWIGFNELFSIVETIKNIKEEREKRKAGLILIFELLFRLIKKIQSENPPGWSHDFQLPTSQKCWLDPKRAEMLGEEKFKQDCEDNWFSEIEKDFAHWINTNLKRHFPQRAKDFNNAEFREWRREFRSAMKLSVRNNEEIFNG